MSDEAEGRPGGSWDPESEELGSLREGDIVDHRYRILRPLGAGAMAKVYLARHLGLQSDHAIKVLNKDLSLDEGLRNRFLAEGRIQAQLRHPNIVAVTDIVTTPVAGLVMERVDGATLDEWLAERGAQRDPEVVLAVMGPVLSAVDAAHRAGVVHRDLKPENILIGRDDDGTLHPKVTDFGIARVLDSGTLRTGKHKTSVFTRMGTLHYMSPEQVKGAQDLGPASDIFSLGAILYELMTGEMAFAGPSEFDTMRSIVEGDFAPPERVVGDLNPIAAACIRKALATDPAERFQSCAEFKLALAEMIRVDGVAPARPSRSAAITQLPGREGSSSAEIAPSLVAERPSPTPPPPPAPPSKKVPTPLAPTPAEAPVHEYAFSRKLPQEESISLAVEGDEPVGLLGVTLGTRKKMAWVFGIIGAMIGFSAGGIGAIPGGIAGALVGYWLPEVGCGGLLMVGGLGLLALLM